MRLRSAITAGGVSRPGLRRDPNSWWPWNRARPAGRTSAPPEPAVLAGRESPRGADPGQGAFLTWAVSGAARPGPIVGTRGVHFRPGQPVRGLARVQWDTARSGLDGRRNPGHTVRRQTGLRADGGFAQSRRAQDWAGSLEDREDPGGAGSLCRSAACRTPRYQHGFSTRVGRDESRFWAALWAIGAAGRGRAPVGGEGGQEVGGRLRRPAVRGPGAAGKTQVHPRADLQYPVHDDTHLRGADGPHTGRTPGTCSNPQGWPP